jgi:hypothetical protein
MHQLTSIIMFEKRLFVNASDKGNPRIWLLPDIYWKITKGMPQSEIDALMGEVERLAEVQDYDALRNYPFIYIGEKCHKRPAPESELVVA